MCGRSASRKRHSRNWKFQLKLSSHLNNDLPSPCARKWWQWNVGESDSCYSWTWCRLSGSSCSVWTRRRCPSVPCSCSCRMQGSAPASSADVYFVAPLYRLLRLPGFLVWSHCTKCWTSSCNAASSVFAHSVLSCKSKVTRHHWNVTPLTWITRTRICQHGQGDQSRQRARQGELSPQGTGWTSASAPPCPPGTGPARP